MLNLRQKDHKSLCDIAKECFKTPIEIWAYGSRVNGDSHDASDLDLVVCTDDSEILAYEELLTFKCFGKTKFQLISLDFAIKTKIFIFSIMSVINHFFTSISLKNSLIMPTF